MGCCSCPSGASLCPLNFEVLTVTETKRALLINGNNAWMVKSCSQLALAPTNWQTSSLNRRAGNQFACCCKHVQDMQPSLASGVCEVSVQIHVGMSSFVSNRMFIKAGVFISNPEEQRMRNPCQRLVQGLSRSLKLESPTTNLRDIEHDPSWQQKSDISALLGL